jgi:hypothetical protein
MHKDKQSKGQTTNRSKFTLSDNKTTTPCSDKPSSFIKSISQQRPENDDSMVWMITLRSRTNSSQEMIVRTSIHERTSLKKCPDSPKTRPPATRMATKIAANEAPASCRGKSPLRYPLSAKCLPHAIAVDRSAAARISTTRALSHLNPTARRTRAREQITTKH